MIARIRNCLLVVLLALLAGSVGIAGWKLTRLMDRAEEALMLTEETLRIGRAALAEQRIYYRALSRMAVLDANRLGEAIGAVEQAIRNEDARLAESHRQLDLLAAENCGVRPPPRQAPSSKRAPRVPLLDGKLKLSAPNPGACWPRGRLSWPRWRKSSRTRPLRKRRPTSRSLRPTWSGCPQRPPTAPSTCATSLIPGGAASGSSCLNS